MFELKKIVVIDNIPEILYYECKIIDKESGECVITLNNDSKSWDQNWQKRLGDSENSEIQDLIDEGNKWLNYYYQYTIGYSKDNPEKFKELNRKMCKSATHFVDFLKMYYNSENLKRVLIPADEMSDFEIEKIINGYKWNLFNFFLNGYYDSQKIS